MKLGVAAAPKCTPPVRNQKLLPSCISACLRVGDKSQDSICVHIQRDGHDSVSSKSLQAFRKKTRVPQNISEFYFSPLSPHSNHFFLFFLSSFWSSSISDFLLPPLPCPTFRKTFWSPLSLFPISLNLFFLFYFLQNRKARDAIVNVRRGVNEVFTLPGRYAAQIGRQLLKFQSKQTGLLDP